MGKKVEDLQTRIQTLYEVWRDAISQMEDILTHEKNLFTAMDSFEIQDTNASQTARKIEMDPLTERFQKLKVALHRVHS